MLLLFTISIIFYQVKMLMFCNVQTTNSTFVGKKKRFIMNRFSIA